MAALNERDRKTLAALLAKLEAPSADDADLRWTIRGVDRPTRQKAVRQAALNGMTVGEWVSAAIAKATGGAA